MPTMEASSPMGQMSQSISAEQQDMSIVFCEVLILATFPSIKPQNWTLSSIFARLRPLGSVSRPIFSPAPAR